MKEEVKKEWIAFLFNVGSTAIGFFIALWVNTYIDNQKNTATIVTKQKMLLHEIRMNEATIDSSFVKFASVKPGFIYAELITAISGDLVKQESFIGYSNDSLMTLIQTYHKHISLLNISRNELNSLRKVKWDLIKQETPAVDMEATWVESILQRRELLFETTRLIRSYIEINEFDQPD